jgi:hypothetical protein
MSRRAAAGRFGVSVSSGIRWHAQRRATGLRARLAERGIAASSSARSRLFRRHGMTRKKRAIINNITEKDRPCRRAGPCGRPKQAPRLVRGAAGSRCRQDRVHRRDLDRDEHRPPRERLHAAGIRQLLRSRRLRCRLIRKCSGSGSLEQVCFQSRLRRRAI